MSDADVAVALSEHPFTKDLAQTLRARLAPHAKAFSCGVNDYMAREGEPASAFYLLASGRASISTLLGARGSVTLQTVGPGDVVGWSWLLPPYVWQFDVRALEPVSGTKIDASELRITCEQDAELGYHLLKQLVAVVGDRLSACRIRLLDIYK
jgi:CRP-like cAMP-binding protein